MPPVWEGARIAQEQARTPSPEYMCHTITCIEPLKKPLERSGSASSFLPKKRILKRVQSALSSDRNYNRPFGIARLMAK